jgi:hypothetical protein
MMHARSASLDFQAHLQYAKIRNSAMPGASVVGLEYSDSHLVSRIHAGDQQTTQQHQIEQSGNFVSRSASESPFQNSSLAHEMGSKESLSGSIVDDDDERLLQQALGESISVMRGLSLSTFCIYFHICRTFEACF